MVSELDEPILVQDDSSLARAMEHLGRAGELAIDTEADSFFSYREKVCLIQITADGLDFLIDPLAGIDLAPIGAVLADPQRLKVFHDGEYDVLLLKRERGFRFANLFDTRVAAAALGTLNPGLASVLHEHFGVQLDKSLQRSNWGQRPLSAKQIAYARLDTHFLLPLMAEQLPLLRERGRLSIVEGECRRLEQLPAAEHAFEPEDWVRIKGARELSPRERRALRELFVLRDELARERDASPFRVLQNAVLLALARRGPRTRSELARVGGMPGRLVRGLGDRILEALERARAMDPIERLPQLARRDGTDELGPEELELYERLKLWRKECSEREKIDASLILNRHVMARLAREVPTTLEELARIEGLLAWQLELHGEDLALLVRRFQGDLAGGRIDLGRRRPRR